MILFLALIFRAAQLQIIPDSRLTALKEKQFGTQVTLRSRRGAITDRNGRDLAISISVPSVYADPRLIKEKKKTAKALSSILGVSTESLFQKIKSNKKRFVWLARAIDSEKAEAIKNLEIRGIKIISEAERVYPNEQLLSHALGFVGGEGAGLEGIELRYNELLEANKQKVKLKRDARGRPLIDDGLMFAENPDGAELRLTIDSDLQHILESELNQAVQEFKADQAFGIVLDAKTSAILATGMSPSYDLNSALKVPSAQRRNRLVTDSFEPGSTMKAFIIAAALKEKLVAPNTRYNTENGRMVIGKRVIREADVKHQWPSLTVSEILAYSSNVGTAKIAFDLGEERARNALFEFGFGAPTGVDLPGEVKGIVHSLPWKQHLFANISFGHGITTTPLQIANAYAAIANGGTLNKPYIVQSIKKHETGETIESKPKAIRRVLDSNDASALRLMLAGSTAAGATGYGARVDGFPVGGKTGTAQKPKLNGRGYEKGAYLSSFVGFLPANDPQIVVYVAVDRPRENGFYGSAVAAPLFSRVAGFSARKLGLTPVTLTERNLASTDLSKLQWAGNQSDVTQGKKVKIKKINLPRIESEKSNLALDHRIPNLEGLSLREALNALRGLRNENLRIEISGSGKVKSSIPSKGEEISENGEAIKLILE